MFLVLNLSPFCECLLSNWEFDITIFGSATARKNYTKTFKNHFFKISVCIHELDPVVPSCEFTQNSKDTDSDDTDMEIIGTLRSTT